MQLASYLEGGGGGGIDVDNDKRDLLICPCYNCHMVM